MRRAVRRSLSRAAGTVALAALFCLTEQAGDAREFRNMADERDDNISDDQDGSPTTGQQSQDNEFGSRGQQAGISGSQPTTTDQSDGMGGQPIGGNDSATGTGTTLTQGADFSNQSDSASGTSDTLTANDDSDFGQGTTSNAGGSSVGTDQTSGGSSGVSDGDGFIGSQGSGSDEYLSDDDQSWASNDQ